MRKFYIVILIILTASMAFAWGEGKYFKKGVKALNEGNLQAAKVFFNEAINTNPKFSRGYSYLALTQTKLGETDDAITNYKLAYKFDDKDYSSLTNLCGLYIQKNELRGAHEACTQALSIKPDSHIALNQRCLVFLKSERYQSAIGDCSQAITLKPDYETAYINRGSAYLALEQFQNAADDFNDGLKINPANANAYNNRCVALKELKNYEDALHDCSKAIVLNGNLDQAYLNRATIYEAIGKKDDAVMDYNNYLRFNPKAETVRQRMLKLMKEDK